MTRIDAVRKEFEADAGDRGDARLSRLRAEGRRRQDDDRLQPGRRARPARAADRADRRQPPVRRPARAAARCPVDAPSILDLPTDRIAESDLGDVLWRDPSGIDILLAPPRIEMAEMVTPRDVEKVLSLLRRVYTRDRHRHVEHLNDINLAFLDASDTIIEIVTYDSTTIHNTIAMADTFRSIGYPASKVRYLVNRADSPGGIDADDLERALGRVPEHRVVSDGRLVVQANNEGVPFVLANPDAPISQDISAWPASSLGAGRVAGRAPGGPEAAMSDPRPIGVFDSGVGGLTVLREIIRRSPAESTIYLGDNARAPYGVRSDDEVLAFSTQCARRARRARRQGHRRRLQHLDRGRARRAPAALRPADPRRHPARRVGRGAGDPQPAGRGHRHAGDDPLARLLRGDQGREPGRRGLRARHADARAAGRGGRAAGPDRRGGRRRGARAAARRARRGRRVDLPAAARRDDRHAAPRLHPLPAAARRSSPRWSATASRSSIRRRRPRPRWPSC